MAKSALIPAGFAFGSFGCRWWLHNLGGLQQRGQLVGTLPLVGVVAAAVVGVAGLGIDEAERRIRNLGGHGQPCLQRMIHVSCSASCARLPEPFRTLEHSILTCAARYTRTCAVAVAALPLGGLRWRDRSQTPLVAHNAPRNDDLHVSAV